VIGPCGTTTQTLQIIVSYRQYKSKKSRPG
jgi:hypothetical protein